MKQSKSREFTKLSCIRTETLKIDNTDNPTFFIIFNYFIKYFEAVIKIL